MGLIKQFLIGCCEELDQIRKDIQIDYFGMSAILQNRHGIDQKLADDIVEYWYQEWEFVR